MNQNKNRLIDTENKWVIQKGKELEVGGETGDGD